MTFGPSRWTRFAVDTTAVWLCPDRPNWFVPTSAGDRLLQYPAQSGSDSELFLKRQPDPPRNSYQGRQSLLTDSPALHELWLHITDRCNLTCSHCLFCSGPDQARELRLEQLKQHVDAAAAQGCRLFALTDGEPLVHPDFSSLIDYIMAIPGSKIAILTNGLLVADKLNADWPKERIHLQVSLDGRHEHHDGLRGDGTFKRLEQQLGWLHEQDWRFTLSCCVTSENAQDLTWMVDYAADQGAAALHLMWHFIRGRGTAEQHMQPQELLQPLLDAMQQAEQRGITIDNIENLKGQIFSPPARSTMVPALVGSLLPV